MNAAVMSELYKDLVSTDPAGVAKMERQLAVEQLRETAADVRRKSDGYARGLGHRAAVIRGLPADSLTRQAMKRADHVIALAECSVMQILSDCADALEALAAEYAGGEL